MNINNLTSLEDDFQEMTEKTKQSMGPGNMKIFDVDKKINTLLVD